MSDQFSVTVGSQVLSLLLPMHVLAGADGRILGAGRTARKLIPEGAIWMGDVFEMTRPVPTRRPMTEILRCAGTGGRIGLRMTGDARLNLRGHVLPVEDGKLLLSLGFGIGLADAVRKLDLTDSDFAPSELAIELLFLHEANRAVMGELSMFNSSLDAARKAAETQASTDVLTGLCNRRGFMLALEAALRAAQGTGASRRGQGFTLAHLDLDHFKDVNDRFGHAAGDEVLCKVAHVLRDVIRDDDQAARFGGDEFVLLLRGVQDRVLLERLALRIKTEVERPIPVPGGSCAVSVSVGMVTSRCFEAPTADQMLAASDRALYQSKHDGRACATIVTAPQARA
ncbi:GGDEF domain-containing protein [Paracoccus sp. (in: a-proteobacteria)]|uniref:GGDEF domain-containing protein n=1 Tax=Paracoccus sp. TaxID=267 RepID=UPI003A877BA5